MGLLQGTSSFSGKQNAHDSKSNVNRRALGPFLRSGREGKIVDGQEDVNIKSLYFSFLFDLHVASCNSVSGNALAATSFAKQMGSLESYFKL